MWKIGNHMPVFWGELTFLQLSFNTGTWQYLLLGEKIYRLQQITVGMRCESSISGPEFQVPICDSHRAGQCVSQEEPGKADTFLFPFPGLWGSLWRDEFKASKRWCKLCLANSRGSRDGCQGKGSLLSPWFPGVTDGLLFVSMGHFSSHIASR